jgi:VanZ family protein
MWTAAILVVNSLSVNDTPVPSFAGLDKLTHVVLYAGAALAWRSALRSPSDRVSVVLVLAIAVLGALDEWHQVMVPGRSADVRDWLADVIGALVGTLLWRRIQGRRRAAA